MMEKILVLREKWINKGNNKPEIVDSQMIVRLSLMRKTIIIS